MFSKSDSRIKPGAESATPSDPRLRRAGGLAQPSLIGADLKVVGNIESAGEVQIDGEVKGDIKCRNVTLGEGAKVKGSIDAEAARICGSITGQIKASSVTLAKTAKVKGDIIQETLTVEAGAQMEGQIRRSGSEAVKDDTKAAAAKPAELGGMAAAAEVAASGDSDKSTTS